MSASSPEIADARAESFRLADGTGNRFLLWRRDGERAHPDGGGVAPQVLAPRVCEAFEVDGLLQLAPPSDATCALAMILHNADGGRAEMCGNGLRIVACAWHDGRGAGRTDGDPLRIETDAGVRDAWPLPDADGIARRARVSLGKPRLLAQDEPLRTGATTLLAHLVDVGNPHCVVFVGDLARVDVARTGAALERHPRFPARTNVEFVERTPTGLRLRVWERGVGETASCGSGVVAAAYAHTVVHGRGRLGAPAGSEATERTPGPEGSTRVETRGGPLAVSFSGDEALLEGPARIRALDEAERVRLVTLLEDARTGAPSTRG